MNKTILIFGVMLILGLGLMGLCRDLLAMQDSDVQEIFNNKCSQCHNVSRALSKTKSLEGWQSTTERMAKKKGSGISEQEAEQIAAYLASLDNKTTNDQ